MNKENGREACELTELEQATFLGIVWSSCYISLTAPISDYLARNPGNPSNSVCDVIQRKMHYAWR